MPRRLDFVGEERVLDRVGDRHHDGQEDPHPDESATESVITENPGDQPEVDARAQRQQHERGPDRVGVLEHRSDLRHRHQGGRVGGDRHQGHLERSIVVRMLHRRLKTAGRESDAERDHAQ